MGVNGVEGTGGSSSSGGFRDMAAQRHQEASFEQMLDIDIKEPKSDSDFTPRHKERAHSEAQEFDGPRNNDRARNDGQVRGDSGNDRAAEARQEAAEYREEAAELRQKAEEVDESGEGAHMRQVYLDRAKAKEEAAVAKDKEADTIEEDRRLNGGGHRSGPVEEFGGVEEDIIPRDQDALPVDGWAPSDQVAAYSEELNSISGFEGAEVTASREATANEVEAFLDLADEMGLQDLEFAEGYLQAFPIQFVYVENLDQFGMDSATNGELMFDNKSIILVDSEFMSDDTTLDMSDTGDAAREAVEYSFGSIIDVMIEMESIETAVMPSSMVLDSLDDDTEDEDEAGVSSAAAPVAGSSDIDGDDE